MAVFWQGSSIEFLSSKVGPEDTQSELLGSLFGALGHQWDHFGAPVSSQSQFGKAVKKASKKQRNSFRGKGGGGKGVKEPKVDSGAPLKSSHFQ